MLRVIAVAGSTAMLFFTYYHPHGRVLWLPLKWNLLFIAINSYRIGKVLLDRYTAQKLSDQMLKLRENHFYVVDLVDFAKLVQLGTVETYKDGDLVVGQGTMNRYIRLVIEGELAVLRDGHRTYTLEEGNFVSEAGLHAGLLLTGKVESCAAIVARDSKNGEGVRLLRWDRTELMDLLLKDKSLRNSLKAALSWDIIRKLKSQRQMLAAGSVAKPEEWTIKRNAQNDQRYASILQNLLSHPNYVMQHRDELNKYRKIHHIDDEHHRLALEQCGWTPEEFELGHRIGHAEDDGDEEEEHVPHYWKWKVSTLLSRIFPL